MTIELWVMILTGIGPLAAWIFWTAIGSKFVSKEEYEKRIGESDAHREAINLKVASLEGKMETLKEGLAKDFAQLNKTLTEIKDSLSPFVVDHQNLRERVTRIEAKSDAKEN